VCGVRQTVTGFCVVLRGSAQEPGGHRFALWQILARLKLERGDTVFVTDTPGGVTITPKDGAFDAELTAARRIMNRRRNVLRELAK